MYLYLYLKCFFFLFEFLHPTYNPSIIAHYQFCNFCYFPSTIAFPRNYDTIMMNFCCNIIIFPKKKLDKLGTSGYLCKGKVTFSLSSKLNLLPCRIQCFHNKKKLLAVCSPKMLSKAHFPPKWLQLRPFLDRFLSFLQ